MSKIAPVEPNALLARARTMDDVQQRSFQMYVGLGPDRSLPKLLPVLKERGIQATARMLRRWSEEWHWSALAELTQRALAQEIAAEAKPELKRLTKEDMAAISTLKARFHQRVKIDPFDAELAPEQRELAIIPDLGDYEKLLRLERLILSDPEDADSVKPMRLEEKLDDSNVLVTLRERTIQIHGLPPKEVIEAGNDSE